LKRAYVLSCVAVLIFDWLEPDPEGPENGVRIELRLLGDTGHRGSESAAQEIVIDRPLWRADLFDLVSGEPGNFARAHYHPNFDGDEPSDRFWAEDLSAVPFTWLARQLSDLEALVATAGALDAVEAGALAADAATLLAVVPEIVAAAESVMVQVRSRARRSP
jgi:hypothetical protein